MNRKCLGLLLVSGVLFILALVLVVPVLGVDSEGSSGSLADSFGNCSVVPFDFKGYAFVNGELYAFNDVGSYKNYIRNGRVLAPIRLITYLLEDLDNAVYWNIHWDVTEPDKVILTTSFEPRYKVVIGVGNKTMEVNGREIALDVPAQMIENRIVLPLRAIGEAVNRKVSWLDGLVVISRDPINLSDAKTKEAAAKAKNTLDAVGEDVIDKLEPVAVYNDGYYALKAYYDEKGKYITELYYYHNGQADKVCLAGEPRITMTPDFKRSGVMADSLYYPTKIGEETKLYRLDFASNKSVEVCSLSEEGIGWSLDNEGWFGGVIPLGKDVFVVLHGGDATMGGDTIYRLAGNCLLDVGYTKSLSSMALVGTRLYYTSLNGMGRTDNNLFYLDLAGADSVSQIGLEGYTYDLIRQTRADFTSLRVPTDMTGLAVRDNYVYAMLYGEHGKKDNRNVVEINTIDNAQRILPIEVNKFWLVGDGIIYQEYTSGKLLKSDFEGCNTSILADKSLDLIKVYGDQVYYTVADEAGLYHLDARTEREEKLSDILTDDILINQSGGYLINQSYDPGIFKISGERVIKVADGFVQRYINTREGILYNKRGSNMVYLTPKS